MESVWRHLPKRGEERGELLARAGATDRPHERVERLLEHLLAEKSAV